MREIDFLSEAELFPSRPRKRTGRRFGYQRFDTAAAAIRFAVEELAPEVLSGCNIEAAEERLNSNDIRDLCESDAYPWPATPRPGLREFAGKACRAGWSPSEARWRGMTLRIVA